LDAQNGLTFTGTARRRFSPLSAGSSVLDALWIVAIILEQPPSAPVARHIERVESGFRELSAHAHPVAECAERRRFRR
jgi:hypothetical protein